MCDVPLMNTFYMNLSKPHVNCGYNLTDTKDGTHQTLKDKWHNLYLCDQYISKS